MERQRCENCMKSFDLSEVIGTEDGYFCDDCILKLKNDCTCTVREPRDDCIEPPEVRVSRNCPAHGDLAHADPDAAREQGKGQP